jgi:hypothetical protein
MNIQITQFVSMANFALGLLSQRGFVFHLPTRRIFKFSLFIGFIIYQPIWAGPNSTEPTVLHKDAMMSVPASAPSQVSLGRVLFPHLHAASTYAYTSGRGRDVGEREVGHHDPEVEGWNFRNFEAGASLRFGEHLEAFGTGVWVVDGESHDVAGTVEECFAKLKNGPDWLEGLELRGGLYFNRFGFQNSLHPHGFDWSDQFLINGRFLGDDGLISTGGELTWRLPTDWTSALSVSFGRTPTGEGHGHEHEDEMTGSGPRFDSDGGVIAAEQPQITANWINAYDFNDFHQYRFTAAGAWGENEFGTTTHIYDLGAEYQWRANGYESGGSYFRWRTEAMLRRFEAVAQAESDDASQRAMQTETGLSTTLLYGWEGGMEAQVRYEAVTGLQDLGLDKRQRGSAGLTYWIGGQRRAYLRAQYNHDWSADHGTEHTVLFQFGLNWGGAEVR